MRLSALRLPHFCWRRFFVSVVASKTRTRMRRENSCLLLIAEACPGRSAARSGALQIRDLYSLKRS
jgi:hypothetical protein